MTLVVSFPGTAQTTLAEVGGKGLSLIRMIEAGLRVPRGAVLTTSFFEPWFEELRASAQWTALATSSRDEWGAVTEALKELCSALPLTERQGEALKELRKSLAGPGQEALFAVRSSSPEEDLASASFAGGYETRLGVRSQGLEAAVRHCFAFSLDERVLVYKREHGFDVLAPRIAIVVQQQIDSEVAGVGFSLNPLTNDYDEAVIDANWGLGESVVAGLASPDHFVVDKVDRRVLERTLGAKQVSIWLDPNGGTLERQSHRSAESTLRDAQVSELTDVLCRIEELYERPMDIEWAYAGDELYVLQARPITAWVPLPPEMLTKPGERRRLYMDAALSDGLTINGAISPMGLDWVEDVLRGLFGPLVGSPFLSGTPQSGLSFTAGCRAYTNLSELLWLASPKALAANGASYVNALLAETLASVDRKRYRTAAKPAYLRFWTLRWIPLALWGLRRFLWNSLRGIVSPERVYRAYAPIVRAYETEMTRNVDYGLPLAEFRRRYPEEWGPLFFDVTLPALVAFVVGGLMTVDRTFRRESTEVLALADNLKRGFPGNVVVEMGIALFRLAKLLDRSELADQAELAERIRNREMAPEFLEAWDGFLEKFGCRGPLEMDLASPRYADDPSLAVRQMSCMSVDEGSFDPEAAQQRQIDERRRAYDELMRGAGWLQRRRLRRAYRIMDLLAGTRDDPKYHLILMSYAVRKRVLIEGRRLVDAGRLDAPDHVFNLVFDDLEMAERDPSLDLRQRREERKLFPDLLKAHVREFPQLIDSRGQILRPPPRLEKPGELSGVSVSPGVVTGPVKVLHDPHQKPIEKGDILVAYTTDPGWTPLFVNAAAVLLEVGGILQHGAVIAREYGKPCVAGVDRLMTKLHDGQRVEVDGTAGVIRLLDD